MLPLFANHLTTLQSEIAHHQQQLATKKQEVEKIQNLQTKVGEALQTLENVVEAIQDTDEKAIAILQEATLSLFENDEASSTNQEKPPTITQETVSETINHSEENNHIKYISDKVGYSSKDDFIVIGLDDEILPELFRKILEENDIGKHFCVEDSTHFNTSYEFLAYSVTEEEAITVADNLEKYLLKIQNFQASRVFDTSIFDYDQKVKVVANKDQQFIGKEGVVIGSMGQEKVYVQLEGDIDRLFSDKELIAA